MNDGYLPCLLYSSSRHAVIEWSRLRAHAATPAPGGGANIPMVQRWDALRSAALSLPPHHNIRGQVWEGGGGDLDKR